MNHPEEDAKTSKSNYSTADTDSQVSQSLLDKFGISKQEKYLGCFSCALNKTILLQGYLYLFESKICFQSYFNPKTLFGETLLTIEGCDVRSVRKVRAYFVNRGLEITTTKQTFVFASLVSREKTIARMRFMKDLSAEIFDTRLSLDETNGDRLVEDIPSTIVQLEQDEEKKQPEHGEIKRSQSMFEGMEMTLQGEIARERTCSVVEEIISPEFSAPTVVPDPFAERKKRQQEFRDRILVAQVQQRTFSQPTTMKWNLDLNVCVSDLVHDLFLDKPYKCSQKNKHQNFFAYFQSVLCKDKDLKMPNYHPVPNYSLNQPSTRVVTFLHPVRERNMLTPEHAACSVVENIYLFSQDEVLQEREVSFSKIPYGDYFNVRTYFYLVGKGETCHLEYGFCVDFVKKTVWKSKIESTTKAENIDLWTDFIKPLMLTESARIADQCRKIIVKLPRLEDQLVKTPPRSIDPQFETITNDAPQPQENEISNVIPETQQWIPEPPLQQQQIEYQNHNHCQEQQQRMKKDIVSLTAKVTKLTLVVASLLSNSMRETQ